MSDNNFSPSSSKICAEETNPSEFLKMQPKKSILKSKQTSLDDLMKSCDESRESSEHSQKEAHFDEMNILATHHPPNKDYGHMKIDEPKTPYTYSDSEEDSSLAGSSSRPRRVSLVSPDDAVNADKLNEELKNVCSSKQKYFEPGSGPEDDEDETDMTSEQIAHKREFERKRREHYNEGLMLRKMREKAVNNTADDEE